MRDARLRQLAEAGVDAVDHVAVVDDVLHRGLRGQHAGARRRIERELHAAGMHAAQRAPGRPRRASRTMRRGGEVACSWGLPVYTSGCGTESRRIGAAQPKEGLPSARNRLPSR